MNIIDVVHDENLARPFFRDLVSWAAWIVVLKAIFALPMEEAELEVYRRHTGRKDLPQGQAREGWLIVGRRGGKSRIAALVAVFLACFRDYADILAPGERGTVMVLAADRKQARTVLRYIVAFLEGVPMLASLIERKTAEGIDLSNGISLEVHTASFRSVRGFTVVAVVLDEVAFWRSEESTNPDVEIVNAVRPAMATVPGALLLGISSPYARRGVLWDMWQEHYGKENDEVLVWQADTLSMNPAVPRSVIDKAYEEDDAAAAAEYGAEFRRDLEAFVSREVVEACVTPECSEIPPNFERVYTGFVDPSGGSADSFTLAIAHQDRGGRRVLDCLRERKPPFSPDEVVSEFAGVLKAYGCRTVLGDRYAGEWPRERFQVHGIEYVPSEKSKNDLYREFLPLLNSGQAALLDTPALIRQLVRLERRTAWSGKDSIDHAPGAHDDLANAAAGVLVLAQPTPDRTARVQEFAEMAFDPRNVGRGVKSGEFVEGMGRSPFSYWRS
ncbi:MAG: hypothetical protein ACYC37_03480 [Desulfobacteria bacterium]